MLFITFVALAVFAAATALSMTVISAAFGALLTRDRVARHLERAIPALAGLSLLKRCSSHGRRSPRPVRTCASRYGIQTPAIRIGPSGVSVVPATKRPPRRATEIATEAGMRRLLVAPLHILDDAILRCQEERLSADRFADLSCA